MALPTRAATADGFEMQMGVNHLAHFALVQALLPALLAAGRSGRGPARVVALSSSGHRLANPSGAWLRSATLESAAYNAWEAYGNSKMAAVLLARELHARHGANGLVATAVHPGGIHTGLQRHVTPAVAALFAIATPFFFKSLRQGAATSVFAAVHPAAAAMGGSYLEDCNRSEVNARANPSVKGWLASTEVRSAFWETSERLVSGGR
jgi:NAD(P)-dependent dehydrogenase (short-subunit alcohol dehydrogenase family)